MQYATTTHSTPKHKLSHAALQLTTSIYYQGTPTLTVVDSDDAKVQVGQSGKGIPGDVHVVHAVVCGIKNGGEGGGGECASRLSEKDHDT